MSPKKNFNTVGILLLIGLAGFCWWFRPHPSHIETALQPRPSDPPPTKLPALKSAALRSSVRHTPEAREAARLKAQGQTVDLSIDQCASSDERTRVRAIQALGVFGAAGEAEEAIPALLEALRGGSTQSRALAAQQLGRFGGRAALAVPDLLNALDDPILRDVAIEAIGKLGMDASAASAALIDILKDVRSRPSNRKLAAWALGEIAPGDSLAAAALESAAERDPDQRARHAAREALERLKNRSPSS